MKSVLSVVEKSPIHDAAAVDRVRADLKINPDEVRRLRTRFFKHGRDDLAALEAISADRREAFAQRVGLHSLSLDQRIDSSLDGATKLLFRTAGGFLIESVVLRPATGRTALCVSSQVGCAAACDFCATGRMGIARDLTAADIVDQLVQANQLLRSEDRRVRNVVFMGMGEPLHNEAALHGALTALTEAATFHHPPSRILVSSVGVPAAMQRLAEAFPTVHQALSLHSAVQGTREEIVPLSRKHTVAELRLTVAQLNRRQRCPVMLEYVMLAGVNDGQEDAAALLAWCAGLRVHVNLIPYNPVADAPHLAGSDRPTIEAFANVLKAAGVPTTVRYSLGADIEAACGQLVRKENRRIAMR
ncbi:Ribosomal RNA large subunit methyltransferase Cfr [Pirellulimonas nuda]|uniref:Ribosomal RNA large subunit methyltransferase Cfr n=1 Tax=Pirellulimonas nuda TaxID=2528009 RepID=A0A518D6T7_9BACT|nr:23S rRNA (adenine(2503)-C(2))-methyltransferase RlmN [Pirellulimonas nuda]QDU87171.1 Ribosomal RNA large subunit methyltransferase Cfr [Pirellulimonas nuda]